MEIKWILNEYGKYRWDKKNEKIGRGNDVGNA